MSQTNNEPGKDQTKGNVVVPTVSVRPGINQAAGQVAVPAARSTPGAPNV